MKKILLVYVPFCTPASPPYSITYLYSFLKNNCGEQIEQIDVLDLNIEFHKLKFPKYQKYYQNLDLKNENKKNEYDQTTNEYNQLTKKVYSENNKKVVKDEKPEFFEELLKKIKDKKPDIAAFSIVYSSQAFYAYSIIKELKQVKDIVTVIGGPAVNEMLVKVADQSLKNEVEFLEFIQNNTRLSRGSSVLEVKTPSSKTASSSRGATLECKSFVSSHESKIRGTYGDAEPSAITSRVLKTLLPCPAQSTELKKHEKDEHNTLNLNFALDFSIYNLKDYFTPEPVIPIKTSTTCYYKKCAFCSHFLNVPYCEYSLDLIKNTIINSKQKYFFMIDDTIPLKRLLTLADMLKPLNIKWLCQLRPTKELDYKTLKQLRESGLIIILWGIESGNARVLKLINKGTNIKDMEKVLLDSHNAGIKNSAFIIFGFPTETKNELIDTIEFLKTNEKNIDLISVSVFGLQKGTVIYNNPNKFGIKKIIEEKRTILEPKISYEVSSGLTQKEANKLKDGYKNTLEKINKYPRTMNFFREHMFCLNSDTNNK